MIRRTINGILVGAAVLLALRFLPGWALFLLLAALGCAVQAEFYQMMSAAGHRSCPVLACAAGLLWMAGKFAFSVRPAPLWLGGPSWEAALLAVLLFLLMLRLLFDPEAEPVGQAAISCLGFLYVPFLLGFFLPLATFHASRPFEFTKSGVFLILYMLLAVKMTDVGAFAVGCSCGRHKMFPRVSPKKSWEGLAGGVATAVAFSVAAVAAAERCEGLRDAVKVFGGRPLVAAAALAVALSLLGVLGDLVESMFKRAVRVKDSGGVIPGMGGFLDMFDSVLFAPALLVLFLKGTSSL